MRRTRFITWCKKDINDERKINYTLLTIEGTVEKFTSEDLMPFSMFERLKNAWIENIELVSGEWYALLRESK